MLEQLEKFLRGYAGTCEDVEVLTSEQNCSLMLVCGTCDSKLVAQVLRLLEVDPFKPPRILLGHYPRFCWFDNPYSKLILTF